MNHWYFLCINALASCVGRRRISKTARVFTENRARLDIRTDGGSWLACPARKMPPKIVPDVFSPRSTYGLRCVEDPPPGNRHKSSKSHRNPFFPVLTRSAVPRAPRPRFFSRRPFSGPRKLQTRPPETCSAIEFVYGPELDLRLG